MKLVLPIAHMTNMNLYVGTSGYSYKEWKGSFYPKDLSAKKMLHYYSAHFRTVEINNTFYRMPTASVLEAWAAEVSAHADLPASVAPPLDFKFVLKAPQRITHFQRLKGAEESVSEFLSRRGAEGAIGATAVPVAAELQEGCASAA
jgi:uncharacterized protein YecE (DUF72 family)